MLNFDFQLINPFGNRWDCIVSKYGNFSKNKAWEANVYKTHSFICISFSLSFGSDHAGLRMQAGLLGYEVELHFYDTRHWDDDTNKWAVYDNR